MNGNKKLKVGFIGLGGRGSGVCSDTFSDMVDMDVEITAICDVFEDRVNRSVKGVVFCTEIITVFLEIG